MPDETVRERRRTNDPEGMRRRVLDVAAEAFQARGYNATSMHDVMRAAGTTGGALYHHFPSKQALGLAVVRERVAQAVEETWMAPVRAARTAAEGIAAVFRRIAAELDRQGRVGGCPLNNLALELSLADPAFRAAVEAVFAAWQAAIAEKIRADQAAGRLTRLDAEETATFVVAAYSGAMAIAKAEQAPRALGVCERHVARLMARG